MKTPQLKNVRKLGSTPGNKSGFKNLKKKKRSSIGISSLSRSKLSTPKFATDTKIETGSQKPKRRNRSNTVSPTTKAVGVKPLMPRVLMKKKYPTDATNPPTIVLDGTDEGIVCDESTNRLVAPPSPEIEILTVKITPNGSKKVKLPKSQAKNSQRIFSKFNIPNPVFPKAQDYIPLTSGEVKSRRQTRNSTGYRFDPKAKPNINFTPMENQMTGRVFSFQGSAAQNEKRYCS